MFMAKSCCLRVWSKSVQDHKGEVRKVRKAGGGEWGEGEFFLILFFIFFIYRALRTTHARLLLSLQV